MEKGKKINKSDFKIEVTMGSGPGGQHRNRKLTAVVITHLPTGMKEKCEDTRSKFQNEEIAMERLLSKIQEIEQAEKNKKQNDFRRKQIQDKKAIRTYNYPLNQVVDHRTGKRANLKKIMDGDLDLLK